MELHMSRRLIAAVSVASLAALAFTPSLADDVTSTALAPAAAVQLAQGPTTGDATPAENVQEDFIMESFDGTNIHYTLFRPAGASASNPVPLVFNSHGWGGSRTKSMTSWMDAGFGALSFDQRGFGSSGGDANVEDPLLEGKDIAGLLDVVQGLDWVMHDVDASADGVWGLDDPTVFASGGSYGGGYQTVGALTEIADHGDTRFDGLAPEITWYSLPEALAPSLVPRSAWLTLLTGAGVANIPQYIRTGYAYGAATGQFPDGTVPDEIIPDLVTRFQSHGPSGFVEGGTYVPDGDVRLNIPTLWRQGSSDTLFVLNEGVKNLENVDESVKGESFLIGYNGGHVLPTALPRGSASGSDPCSAATEYGSFLAMTQAFFLQIAAGESTAGFLDHPYGIADMDGNCNWSDTVRPGESDGEFAGFDAIATTGTVSLTGAGAPVYYPVFTAGDEATVISGVPSVDATYYSASADQRVFFGLAKGTSQANATVMQHQMMPHRELLPSIGHDITVQLGGGGMTVMPGETVYLVVSPFADLFFAHGSVRTPGVVALEDITVNLPFQR
ncbi:MAG: ABC-2 type transport system ATP-binding protein [Nitriliruptoraceae bacterium]|jgi:ABC-2 type transport system ATP-binding protein